MKKIYRFILVSLFCVALPVLSVAQDAPPQLVQKTIDIANKYTLGVVKGGAEVPTDEEMGKTVLAFAAQQKGKVVQVGWYVPNQKKGFSIVAVAETIDKVNVSIVRPKSVADEVRLERMLAYPTSPEALSNQYLENEVVADDDFQGKPVVFEGVVSEIAKGAFNQPYVFFPSTEGSYSGLTCYFEAKSPEIRRIRKGSQVLVRGVVKGFLMQDVILERCEIIQIR